VPNQTAFPPSLKNIFKEIESDLWRKSVVIDNPDPEWRLVSWAKQWVLLLNAILSVEATKAASHSKIWWQKFTDEIIKTISREKEWVVFILWGNFAKSKKEIIDTNKHFIIEWVHPSPLSASRWFFWSKPFSKTNEILKKQWKKEINW
jgi:uracil-DNA glycosylase